MSRKTYEGTVQKSNMAKTIVVMVSRKTVEDRTGKIVSSRKKYKVHCEDASILPGDVVSFEDCKPISKDKKWRLVKVIKKIVQAAEIKED
jgi:small subunit ribosomal protein S17